MGSASQAFGGPLSLSTSSLNTTLTAPGTGTPATLTNVKINSYDTVNAFIQNNIQNLSSGNAASSDWIATANNGTDSTNYVDFGINGSGYSQGTWTINGAGDGYLYSQSTHLAVGTATAAKNVTIFTGGTLLANARLTVSDTKMVCGVPLASVSSSESTGSASAALGSNCPATSTLAPYKWIKFFTADGSTVYVPAWK